MRAIRFVERIRGRMNDMVYHRDGRISVAEHFMTVMNFMPEVIAWRAVQEDYEHITMLLVRNPDVAEQEQEAISRRIVDGLAKTLDDPTFKITCTWMNDIPADPSGKLRLVVSKMKEAGSGIQASKLSAKDKYRRGVAVGAAPRLF